MNNERIAHFYFLRTKITMNEKITCMWPYVINKENSGCLLSKEAALKFDVVQLNIPVNEHRQTVNHVYKEIADITEYEEVFQGTGKLKDFQLQLHIDNTHKF